MKKSVRKSIGIIGMGFVGKAVAKGFMLFAVIRTYDIIPELSSHSFKEVINSDIVFICLPTPINKSEKGKCDLSIIYGFFDKLSGIENRNKKTIFVIKSTVPIGTTKKLSKKYNINNLLHCPEFLTARAALIDFICPARNIIGGKNQKAIKILKQLLEERFPGTSCHIMTSDESEFIKYAANCFFAVKVSYFNEIKLLTEKLNLDWDKILKGILTDGRIGQSHYEVPGYDGKRGYGGSCFPKDINAFIHIMKDNKVDPILLKASWKQNMKIREK